MESFRNFLDSYLENSAGVDHELLILYKGFTRENDAIVPFEKLLIDIPHACLMVSDYGYDLRAYCKAAKTSNCKYICFLNSFSVILEKDWLLKLYYHISRPGVGLVGTSGSWLGIGHVRPIPKKEGDSYLMHVGRLLYKIPRRFFIRLIFCPYPNYHIRTTGFMMTRNIMLKIRKGLLLTKFQSKLLESGKWSITRQILSMNLKPVVVGRNGIGYEKHQWNISNTFWQGAQENLLISDNQTRSYDIRNLAWKKKREIYTWVCSHKIYYED